MESYLMDRRTFLRASITTAGIGTIAPSATATQTPTQQHLQSPSLAKYVDPLPRPSVAQPVVRVRGGDGLSFYDVSMEETTQKLHRDLPETTLWGYEGSYPGPTIEARHGEQVIVRWHNNLPREHLLPVDNTIHGAINTPEVRTVPHLHGGNVPPHSDGYPDAWFTPDYTQTGPFFRSATYTYPNEQPPATLWYHDHAIGITRLNVYAGLAGFYLLRDDTERELNLPSDEYEIPIVLQDRTFADDGSLVYPADWEPEFFGDTAVINGTVWPYLDVEPRKYRLRFLNGSNARFYNVKLFDGDGQPGPAFHQIGTDGGLLSKPVTLNDPDDASSPRLLLGPGERADVVLDFSEFAGSRLRLHSNAKTPFKSLSQQTDEVPLSELMQVRVADRVTHPDESQLPAQLRDVPSIPEQAAQTARGLELNEAQDEEVDRLEMQINGLDWDEPITEAPTLGSTEIWQFINITEDVHPMHLHLVQFQILDRRPFDVERYEETGELVFTDDPVQPEVQGWKDTVPANPGEVTRVIAHFGEYEGRFKDLTGRYVFHCHILEHEDNEMMRPYAVLSKS